MGVDINSIPAGLLAELRTGLRTRKDSIAHQVCSVVTRKTTLEGSVPLKSSKTTLARRHGRLAEFEEKPSHGGDAGSVQYSCGRYQGVRIISVREKNDFEVFGEDVLADRVDLAYADAMFDLDYDLMTLLSSTTLNTAFSVTGAGFGAWTSGSSKPLKDLQKIKSTILPGADRLIMGADVGFTLASNANLLAGLHNFSGGSIPFDRLAGLIAEAVDIPAGNVHIVSKQYNAANEGQAVSTAVLGSGLVWFGVSENLMLIDPEMEENSTIDVERNPRQAAYEAIYTQWADLLRPLQETAIVLTNVL